MIIELTEAQEKALGNPNGELPRVVAPTTHVEYILIRKDEYDTVAEALEDDRLHRAFCDAALKDAAKRFLEDE